MKNTEMEKKINELSPEMLDLISGGALTEERRAMIINSIETFKAAGVDKNEIIQFFKGLDSLCWEEYRNGEDNMAFLKFLDENWTE